MARVTVEDSLKHVGNRFHLVLLASKRAREIAMGSEAMLAEENDKPTVIALREIADGLIDMDYLNKKKPTVVDTTEMMDALSSSPSL